MNTDLQDIIAQSTIRAFNAGFEHGKRFVLDAVETVAFDYDDLKVAAINDLEEELQIKAAVKVVPQVTLSEADLGKEHAAG